MAEPARDFAMSAHAVTLHPTERVMIDPAVLLGLTRRLGPHRAEAYVAKRVEEITDQLAEIDDLRRIPNFDRIATLARFVADRADAIGLLSLARVARDLAQVAQQRNRTALAAVWARLVRIGNHSLEALWEAPGLQM